MGGTADAAPEPWLAGLGVAQELWPELIAYGAPLVGAAALEAVPPLPLPDEPHLEAWSRYAAEALERGVLEALAPRFGQLCFPIREGTRGDPEYQAATRRGALSPLRALSRLPLEDPGGLRLELAQTPAGRLPILTARARADFVTLVQAFTARNEPAAVPDAMGACIVSGLNNWDRVAAYRRAWEARAADASEDAWLTEFRAGLVPRKGLYQDRFLILSSGPYSGVAAGDAGFAEEEWRALSLAIRREHETCHYFTLRLAGAMRTDPLDELLADFAGLLGALGRYPRRLALRFLGLEDWPAYRAGGRLEDYCRDLSPAGFEAMQRLAGAAVANLEALAERHPGAARGPGGRGRLVLAAGSLSLWQLASQEAGPRLDAALQKLATP